MESAGSSGTSRWQLSVQRAERPKLDTIEVSIAFVNDVNGVSVRFVRDFTFHEGIMYPNQCQLGALLLDIVGDGNSFPLRLRGQRVTDHAEHYNPGSLFLSKKNMVSARI